MSDRRDPVRWLHRLGLGRPRPEESTTWEIEHHLDELVDRLIAEGWEPGAARGEAERRFGDRRRYEPSMRRMEAGRLAILRWEAWWELIGQSARSVLLTARRSPGFTAGVVLTLGLGIGANATMYGIVDRLLLRPPDGIVDAGRVRRVLLQRPDPLAGRIVSSPALTYPDYADLKAHESLTIAAYTSARERTVTRGGSSQRARVATAAAELFPLLGVSPEVGRFYTPEAAAPGGNATAVIGHAYWREAFGRDPGVVGRTIDVGGRSHTIVGVAPAGFTGAELSRVDVWVPLELTQTAENGDACLRSRGCWWLRAVARLNEDATVEAAESEATELHLTARSEQIAQGRYTSRAKIVLAPLIAARGPNASAESRVARWLAGVSLIVLLIACANVANLLLARGTRQRHELGVRLALGASGRRVATQAVLESMGLALLGGVLALTVARWGGGLVRSTLLPGVYFPGSALTGWLVLYTLAASIASGLVSGVPPALRAARVNLARGLGEGGRGSVERSRLRATLVVFQAAMCVVLLVGAGLFVRSVGELRGLDLGFDADHVALARLELSTPRVEPSRQSEIYQEAARRVSTLPGVRSVATTSIPFQFGLATYLEVPRMDSLPQLPGGGPYEFPVSGDYFETIGLSMVAGRPIEQADIDDHADVAVVSAKMAETLWPGDDALGHCLLMTEGSSECTTVVGVVEDAARSGFEDQPFMASYLPWTKYPNEPIRGIYLRAGGRADEIVAEAAALLRSSSADVRYAEVQPLRDILDPQARSWTLGATMFTVFGMLALVLAAIGLYSVLAFDVAQRMRELGIRAALGAERSRLLRSVLYQGTRVGLLGIMIGVAVAYTAAPYARDLLFHVSPRDPQVLGGVAATLIVVSALASLIPGIRATHVDPARALRSE